MYEVFSAWRTLTYRALRYRLQCTRRRCLAFRLFFPTHPAPGSLLWLNRDVFPYTCHEIMRIRIGFHSERTCLPHVPARSCLNELWHGNARGVVPFCTAPVRLKMIRLITNAQISQESGRFRRSVIPRLTSFVFAGGRFAGGCSISTDKVR